MPSTITINHIGKISAISKIYAVHKVCTAHKADELRYMYTRGEMSCTKCNSQMLLMEVNFKVVMQIKDNWMGKRNMSCCFSYT